MFATNVQDCLDAIRTCLPSVDVTSAVPLLTGWGSIVVEVNGEWMFRFPRRPELLPGLGKEIALLPALSAHLSVPVPRFEFVWEQLSACSVPFVGYRKLHGVPLKDALRAANRPTLIREVSGFLSELQAFPVDRLSGLGISGDGAAWREKYVDLRSQVQNHIVPLLDSGLAARAGALFEEFLSNAANFTFAPVLVHGDLWTEHILVDPRSGRLSGVIDWEDATFGDPAFDFTGLWLDCGPDFAQDVAASYRGRMDAGFWSRVAFYAKVVPFYEIAYGLETSDERRVHSGLNSLREALSD